MGAHLGVAVDAEQEKNRKKKSRSATEKSTTNTLVTGATTEGASGTGMSQIGQGTTTVAEEPRKYDQCGLEDDSDEWTEWEGPQRIRTCQLTEAEQTKFRGIVNKIFSYDTAVLSIRAAFSPEEVWEVMDKVIPYLESEPMLIEDLPFGISVVGDLHGQLYDLHRIFTGDGKDGMAAWERRKYIFLGNYVDKGRQSLEIIMALFCIKMLRPDDIFLIRGNHEFINANSDNGFKEEMLERYEEETAELLYCRINEAFCYLSIAAILGNTYFCSHGGVAGHGLTRRALKSMVKPITRSTDDCLIHDIVNADPLEGLIGAMFNLFRRTSDMFGPEVLAFALANLDVKAAFRGHSLHKSGFKIYSHMMVSVYSATDCQGQDNKGAVAVLDERGKLSFRVLNVCEKRKAFEKRIRELEGKPAHCLKEKKMKRDKKKNQA